MAVEVSGSVSCEAGGLCILGTYIHACIHGSSVGRHDLDLWFSEYSRMVPRSRPRQSVPVLNIYYNISVSSYFIYNLWNLKIVSPLKLSGNYICHIL
jgi:hypothetical protein